VLGNSALLIRGPSSPHGTFGLLSIRGVIIRTAELPWRDNTPQLSCIPVGTYECRWVKSPRFGYVYQVTGVPGRGNILIHAGNFVGDSLLGLRTHSHGCILPCKRIGVIDGQQAGLLSGPAVSLLSERFNKQPFTLEIRNA